MPRSRTASEALVVFFSLLVTRAPAPWVPMKQMREWSQSVPTTVSDFTVPLEAHRMHPGALGSHGYDSGAVGNLEGVQRVGTFRGARNHALVAQVEVGTPWQQMSCMMDASSADLWFPSIRCKTCAKNAEEAKSFFHAKDSKTFHPELDATMFGAVPRAIREVYSGGFAAGFVVRDNFKIAGAQSTNQTFLLAEELDMSKRRSRAWDGVCGFGWGVPEGGGVPFFRRMKEVGKMMVIAFTPAPQRLTVGALPTEPQNVVWTKALDPERHQHHKGMWVVEGKIVSDGTYTNWQGPAKFAFETGTSFLLAPPSRYVAFMDSLLVGGAFGRLCGVDERAGNIVVCKCEAKRQVARQVGLSFRDDFEISRDFPLLPEDLFEDVGGGLCVPQIQQRPASADLRNPGGALGDASPTHRPGAELMPPVGLLPLLGTALAGHAGQDPSKAKPKAGSAPPLNLGPLAAILGGMLPKDTVVKEVVVETLGDGTRCETDVYRAGNGTLLNSTTKEKFTNGTVKKEDHGPTCSHTRSAAKSLAPRGRRLQTKSSDLWIVGDIFLKRYGVIFDFDQARLGFIRGTANQGTGGATVEAFQPTAGGMTTGVSASTIQRYSTGPAGKPPAPQMQDTSHAHVRAAAGHLMQKSQQSSDGMNAGAVARLLVSGGMTSAFLSLVAWACIKMYQGEEGREPVILEGLSSVHLRHGEPEVELE